MPFASPMIWIEPNDHVCDCYYCLTQIKGIITKSKHTIWYPNLSSTDRPILHSAELLGPKAPNRSESKDSTPKLVLCQHGKEDSEKHLLTQRI